MLSQLLSNFQENAEDKKEKEKQIQNERMRRKMRMMSIQNVKCSNIENVREQINEINKERQFIEQKKQDTSQMLQPVFQQISTVELTQREAKRSGVQYDTMIFGTPLLNIPLIDKEVKGILKQFTNQKQKREMLILIFIDFQVKQSHEMTERMNENKILLQVSKIVSELKELTKTKEKQLFESNKTEDDIFSEEQFIHLKQQNKKIGKKDSISERAIKREKEKQQMDNLLKNEQRKKELIETKNKLIREIEEKARMQEEEDEQFSETSFKDNSKIVAERKRDQSQSDSISTPLKYKEQLPQKNSQKISRKESIASRTQGSVKKGIQGFFIADNNANPHIKNTSFSLKSESVDKINLDESRADVSSRQKYQKGGFEWKDSVIMHRNSQNKVETGTSNKLLKRRDSEYLETVGPSMLYFATPVYQKTQQSQLQSKQEQRSQHSFEGTHYEGKLQQSLSKNQNNDQSIILNQNQMNSSNIINVSQFQNSFSPDKQSNFMVRNFQSELKERKTNDPLENTNIQKRGNKDVKDQLKQNLDQEITEKINQLKLREFRLYRVQNKLGLVQAADSKREIFESVYKDLNQLKEDKIQTENDFREYKQRSNSQGLMKKRQSESALTFSINKIYCVNKRQRQNLLSQREKTRDIHSNNFNQGVLSSRPGSQQSPLYNKSQPSFSNFNIPILSSSAISTNQISTPNLFPPKVMASSFQINNIFPPQIQQSDEQIRIKRQQAQSLHIPLKDIAVSPNPKSFQHLQTIIPQTNCSFSQDIVVSNVLNKGKRTTTQSDNGSFSQNSKGKKNISQLTFNQMKDMLQQNNNKTSLAQSASNQSILISKINKQGDYSIKKLDQSSGKQTNRSNSSFHHQQSLKEFFQKKSERIREFGRPITEANKQLQSQKSKGNLLFSELLDQEQDFHFENTSLKKTMRFQFSKISGTLRTWKDNLLDSNHEGKQLEKELLKESLEEYRSNIANLIEQEEKKERKQEQD